LDSSDGERIDRDAVDQSVLHAAAAIFGKRLIGLVMPRRLKTMKGTSRSEAATKKAVKKVDNSRKRVARRLVR
jgi:hypothetical protein